MQAFYTGLGGMFNFSKSLDNVSNNVSNMNTPGFKGNDVFIRSLGDGQGNYGSQVNSSSIRTQSGDLRQTGNETDLAITGNGYFILQNTEGTYFYTRAGQFKFDNENRLVDSATGYTVMSVNDLGLLQSIDISQNRVLPPVATTEIRLLGNLDPNSDTPHEVEAISVYDATGERHDLRMTFTLAAAPLISTWDVVVLDEAGTNLASFQIAFGQDFTPLEASSNVTRTVTLNGQAQTIEFGIGAPGSYAGATQFVSGGSALAAAPQDGHAALGLRSIAFTEDGVMEFKYANGEIETGQQIALAHFNDPTSLQPSTTGLMRTSSSVVPVIGRPNSEAFGSIQAKSLEMSNIDLTQEFADILIIQRGYQASSRVMSVSNDMLEQLYNNTRSR